MKCWNPPDEHRELRPAIRLLLSTFEYVDVLSEDEGSLEHAGERRRRVHGAFDAIENRYRALRTAFETLAEDVAQMFTVFAVVIVMIPDRWMVAIPLMLLDLGIIAEKNGSHWRIHRWFDKRFVRSHPLHRR